MLFNTSLFSKLTSASKYRAALTSVLIAIVLAACSSKSSLQGVQVNGVYHAPQKSYDLPLDSNVFRGQVAIDERCDRSGVSTTFYDSNARMFAIDTLMIDVNDLAKAPSFASNQTMMNMVLNNYLRNAVRESDKVVATDTVVRKYLRRDDSFDALFAIVDMEVDADLQETKQRIKGTYYYGFLLFKQGDRVFVVQHRQPALMEGKMQSILLSLADNLTIPGSRLRNESEQEQFARSMHNLKVKLGLEDENQQREDGDTLVCELDQWSNY